LLKKGIHATIRWSKGQDIEAACGQLITEATRKRPSSTEVTVPA
jgi:adenine C2-methylase RlmN of 23S rRNA A2503 and tRNA A37